jgi:hypothetical protein
MTAKGIDRRGRKAPPVVQEGHAMSEKNMEVIESTVGQVATVAAELARRGIDPDRPVTITIEPDDWLTKARRKARKRVEAFGLSDEDIDRLIKEARREANEDMCREAKPSPT